MTASSRADRSFEAGDCDAALDLYEEAMKEGSRDPEVYTKAAICSTRLGAFVQAERYYSRALRYGGGPEVALSLSKLYLQTSNYAKAVRVLQALVNDQRLDPQPVYNNLGTALMYANEPMEAESYLLIAQQLDPKDPYPYANLGLLYDRHMKRPPLAMSFYQCYLTLYRRNAPQSRTVAMRISELKKQNYIPDESVVCGESYKPKQPSASSFQALQALKAKSKAEDEALEAKEKSKTPGVTSPKQPSRLIKPLAIDVARERAKNSFLKAKYGDVLQSYQGMAVSAMSASDSLLVAKSHRALKQWGDAQLWYERAFEKQPEALYLQGLIDVVIERKNTSRLNELCTMYNGQAAFTSALTMCPSPSP